MVLYNYLLKDQQAVICDFVSNFYAGKNVYINQDIEDRKRAMYYHRRECRISWCGTEYGLLFMCKMDLFLCR